MRRKALILFVIVLMIVSILVATIYNGLPRTNNPSNAVFPVFGVDVSEYQGKINWFDLEEQGVEFAFIKATEGSAYIDPYLESNISESKKTNIRIGAYHFFSFESSGETQADNFISVVPINANMLPPVIDLELYGRFKTCPPKDEDVWTELQILIDRLSNHYRVYPIIYVTEISYRLYIKDKYSGPIWIRNVYTSPSFSSWTFWQYTDKGVLYGYNGKEKYIDFNVFNGSKEDFANYFSSVKTYP